MITELKNRISELGNLHDNWNMYGAVAPSDEVINNTYKLLDVIINDGYTIKAEDIFPTTYGSIVMDFENERGLISVEVGKKGIGFFTEFVENNKDFSLDKIETDFCSIPTALKEAFSVLYNE